MSKAEKLKTVGEFTAFVGRRIKTRRKAAKMTQDELAEKIGVGGETLREMELGRGHINLERLIDCVRHLPTTTGDLLGLPHYNDEEMADFIDKRIRAMSEEDLRRWKQDPGPATADRRRLFILDSDPAQE